MIVIPERCGFLSIRIVVSRGFTWPIRVLRPPIARGRDSPSMKVNHRSRFRQTLFRAHEIVVNGKKVFGGQLVAPLNRNRLTAASLYNRARHAATVAPEPGRRNIPVNSRIEFNDWNRTFARNFHNWRNGQRIHKRRHAFRIYQQRRWRHWRHARHLRGSSPHTAADQKPASCNAIHCQLLRVAGSRREYQLRGVPRSCLTEIKHAIDGAGTGIE